MLLRYFEINFIKLVYGRFDVRFVKRFTELYGISPYYFKHEIPTEVDYRDWIDLKSEEGFELNSNVANALKVNFKLTAKIKEAFKYFGKPESMDYYSSARGMTLTYIFRSSIIPNLTGRAKLRLLCLNNHIVALRIFRNTISPDPDIACRAKKDILKQLLGSSFNYNPDGNQLFIDRSTGIGVKILDSIIDYDIMVFVKS